MITPDTQGTQKGTQKKSDNSGPGKAFRVNEQIKSKEIHLIDHNGTVVGVVGVEEGIRIAKEAGLDLVEVSPNASPPVCKIANFGKMKYEMQKRASAAKKKQKVVELKEIKMSLNIAKNDFDIKIRQAQKFIEKDCRVKVSIRLRGREMANLKIAYDMMDSIVEQAQSFSKTELNPRLEGSQMIVILTKK